MYVYDGLVGGNPTMNTPRLRRGGGGDSFLLIYFIFLPVLVFLYILYILFVTQLPSLERWALHFLFGVFLP